MWPKWKRNLNVGISVFFSFSSPTIAGREQSFSPKGFNQEREICFPSYFLNLIGHEQISLKLCLQVNFSWRKILFPSLHLYSIPFHNIGIYQLHHSSLPDFLIQGNRRGYRNRQRERRKGGGIEIQMKRKVKKTKANQERLVGVHVRSILCYLICLMHLIKSAQNVWVCKSITGEREKESFYCKYFLDFWFF